MKQNKRLYVNIIWIIVGTILIGPGGQALSGHKRSNTLAVELPPQARGTGTLIPSVRAKA